MLYILKQFYILHNILINMGGNSNDQKNIKNAFCIVSSNVIIEYAHFTSVASINNKRRVVIIINSCLVVTLVEHSL